MSTRTAVPSAPPRTGAIRTARRVRHHTARGAVGFLVPFGVLFTAVMVAPIGYAIYESLYKVHRHGLLGDTQTTEFAGLANYSAALRDADFTASLLRVAVLGVIQVPAMLALALLLALLLDSRSARLVRAFRLTFFLPYALPGAIAAVMWSFLLVKDLSPFTGPLAAFGIHTDFLSSSWMPFSIGNMITWSWTGYNMLIIYSALRAVPSDILEAATLDGCTGWRLATKIKVPLVRPALVLTAVFSIIGTAQLYTEPAVLYAARIPAASPKFTPIMNTALTAAQADANLAAAESVVLALATLVLSFGFLKLTQRKAAGQ